MDVILTDEANEDLRDANNYYSDIREQIMGSC